MARRFRAPNVAKTFEQLRGSTWDIYQYIVPHDVCVSADYTTSGKVAHEFVITDSTGTGTHTISLHATPRLGDMATVKRGGTKAVTVDTAGTETIDGGNSFSLASQYDMVTVRAVNDSSTDTASINYVVIAEMVN